MPRRSKGIRLWLRPARIDKSGYVIDAARWIIKDAGRQIGTGCGATDREEAERRLADYIAAKYKPARRERDLAEILVADVIAIYLADVAPDLAHPKKAAERAERLIRFFGEMTLDQINGQTCRAYAASRNGQGKTNKGTGGGARRDLQDLAAAIGHHSAEGLHRGNVRVRLPKRGKARQRWLTRSEFACLLWTCYRTREVQEGKQTDKFPLRHLCRFLLLGIYTGSRPGVVLNATWFEGPGLSFVDTNRGVFHRFPNGAVETDKRQPPVRLADGLAAHLRRWERADALKWPRPIYVVTYAGMKISSVKTAFFRACKLAGLDDGVIAYTLRHSAASWLVQKGKSTRDIAEYLGTGEQMIRAHYGHLAPDYQMEMAQAIGRK